MQTTTDVNPVELGRPPVKLYSADNELLDLSKGEEGTKEPFDETFLGAVKRALAKYGVDMSLLLLIFGSGAGTVFGGLRARQMIIDLMGADAIGAATLFACFIMSFGLTVEFNAAWSWSRRGTTQLVGQMTATNDGIFKRSAFCMFADIVLSVSALVITEIHIIGIGWMMLGQPGIAIRNFWALYQLKGQHPAIQAEQLAATVRARTKAALILDAASEINLELDGRKYSRQRAKLDSQQRHMAGVKVLTSGKYRRTIEKIMDRVVLLELVGEAKEWSGMFRSRKLQPSAKFQKQLAEASKK